MGEFLSNYGFFILIAALLLYAHLAHGGHRHPPYQGPRDADKDAAGTSPEAAAKGRRSDRGA